MNEQSHTIFPLGDSALIIDFGNVIDEATNNKVLALADAINKASIHGVIDVVPCYSSLAIHYDIISVLEHGRGKPSFTTIKEKLESLLLLSQEEFTNEFRNMRIPVCYAKKYGWDLDEIAAQTKLPVEEVITIHTSGRYKVYMIGFLPAFAYMGEVDERIAMPRRSEPRLKIEAGCVGIAGKQTGVYPLTSPGGWQIIGRTPVKLFDKNKAEPALLKAGDIVEFFSISEDEFKNY